ncbi:MAG: polyamine aminopropyltransferase [Dehalococcoidales bacterium]|nr:polyamine aminopropyltransferase [Dehalococcoidales bacterium]
MDIDPKQWLRDKINENFLQLHRLDEVLYSGRTKYQFAQVVRTRNFGVCLVLDGKVQSSEKDEFIYHEALVHPAMLVHPNPEVVFIAGGGEGATLREVFRHRTVKRAVMVEIDQEVMDLSQKYLPELSGGALADRRTELHLADARKFLESSSEKYDVIILDLPDPVEGGPACLLFTREFYQVVLDHLKEDGIVSIQAGSASPTELLILGAVINTLKLVFPLVVPYAAYVPCYGGPWGLCLASRHLDPSGLSPEQVDGLLAGRKITGLRFYDGITHRNMFSLPKYVREGIARQKRVITDSNPLYLYGT